MPELSLPENSLLLALVLIRHYWTFYAKNTLHAFRVVFALCSTTFFQPVPSTLAAHVGRGADCTTTPFRRLNLVTMSSPASSGGRGRPTRNSATPARSSIAASQEPQSTPARSTRSAASRAAQNAMNATPRATGQQSSTAVASSSPMFFQSSPANGAQPANSAADRSSPMRASSDADDGETTPRASRQFVGGMKMRK